MLSDKTALFIYSIMIELHQGQSDEKVIVTLTELQTLNEPFFLFRFIHATTKAVVSIIKSSQEDESEYPERYNQFAFDTNNLFQNQLRGEWHYWVYEQASNSNIDPELSGALLENGKMYLYPPAGFEFEKYDQPVTYKAYNG